MVWSFKPWRKKVGQLTPRMFALLSKASFATSWPRYPTNSFARDFTLTKGLTRTRAPGLAFLRSSRATPVPMDLPMTMMFCYWKPSLEVANV